MGQCDDSKIMYKVTLFECVITTTTIIIWCFKNIFKFLNVIIFLRIRWCEYKIYANTSKYL